MLFSFSFQVLSNFSFDFIFDHGLFISVIFSFWMRVSHTSFCSWFLIEFCYSQGPYHVFLLFPLSGLLLWPRICSILVNVLHACEKNVYSVLLDRKFYKYWLGQAGWKCCLPRLYWLSRRVWTSQSIIVNLSLSPCSSISFCFMYPEALLGTLMCRTVMCLY